MKKKIKLFGQTTADQLIELSKRLNVKVDGIFDINQIKKPLPKKGSYIILLNKDGDTGHWVCQHDGDYFDSMGESAPTVLNIKKWNHIQYQGTYDEFCGQWCLVFLHGKQHGVNHFKKMTDLNLID
jgi:hypothetical protein